MAEVLHHFDCAHRNQHVVVDNENPRWGCILSLDNSSWPTDWRFLCGGVRHGKDHPGGSSFARGTAQPERATKLQNKAVDHGQAEARALAEALGREKRLYGTP